MIKAILFDIDGVLLDSLKANYQYYQNLFKKLEKSFISFSEYKEKYFSMPVKEVIQNLAGLEGNELENKYQEIKNSRYFTNLIKVPKGEKETIKNLFKQYKLAIVTGRFSIKSTFSITGLKKYFEVVVKFGDYQKPKPDPEPLLVALKKFNLKPEEAIYVGDSLVDLQAAKALKMKFIGFYGISGKIFKEADANIKTFAELSGAIEKLS